MCSVWRNNMQQHTCDSVYWETFRYHVHIAKIQQHSENKSYNNSVYFIYFPDRHINFWTTVEDGNLSQTFFVNIIIWKYKYKIRLSTFDMWETPIHYYYYHYYSFLSYILQQGLSKPYDNLKDAFRCQSSLSVSRHKKLVNIKNRGKC